MTDVLAWSVWIPLAGAVLTFILGRRHARAIGMAASLATLLAVVLTLQRVWDAGPQRYEVGGWSAPLGIDLVADGLSAVMLVMTASIGVFISWYASGYFTSSDEPEIDRDSARWTEADSFWPLWLFLWAALNVIFLSSDIFNVYVGLEIMGMTAVALVILADARVALIAGMRYLLAALIGSLSWLMGVAVLYAAYGTLDVALLGSRLAPNLSSWGALTLMTAGLMLKTALFPLHFWLPAAHASAPSPVSAILSALVVKASFYLTIRLWIDVFPAILTTAAGSLVGVVASAAIIWGSLQAIRQSRLKLLIAYSTIAQIGYLFMMVPLMLPATGAVSDVSRWNVAAWEGGVYQVVSHAFAKAAMFMSAGSILYALKPSEEIADMSGVAARLPVTTLTFGLASVSLMGLPPSGGFAAKWLLLTASVESRQWWWTAVLIVGGLLTAVYLFKFLGQTFQPAEEQATFRPVPSALEIPGLLLAIVAFISGLLATFVFDMLDIGLGPFQ